MRLSLYISWIMVLMLGICTPQPLLAKAPHTRKQAPEAPQPVPILSASAIQDLAADKTIETIQKRGVIKIAMHKQDRPPFFMVNKAGKLIGIDVEIAEDIAKRLGVTIDYNRTSDSFDAVVLLVEKGECDIAISKLSLTLGRAQRVLYTKPYITMSKSVLLNRIKLLQLGEQKSLEEIFQDKDSIIAALDNSSYEAFAHSIFPNAHVHESPDWDTDTIPKLMKGEVWGAFRDELEVRRSLFVYKDASLRLLAVNLKDEQDPIMMVVPKNASSFKVWLDLYIEHIYKKETITEAIHRFSDYIYRK